MTVFAEPFLAVADVNQIEMRKACSRTIPFLDVDTLVLREAREALFRDQQGFLFYLAKDVSSAPAEERLFRVGVREALLWLNEHPHDQGSFWA